MSADKLKAATRAFPKGRPEWSGPAWAPKSRCGAASVSNPRTVFKCAICGMLGLSWAWEAGEAGNEAEIVCCFACRVRSDCARRECVCMGRDRPRLGQRHRDREAAGKRSGVRSHARRGGGDFGYGP